MNILDYLNKDELEEYTYIKEYTSNMVVFNEGELCNKIGIIINGEINISTYTYNNHKEIINNLTNNDIFGNYLIHSSSPYYLGSAITLRKTKICFIQKDNLNKLFKINNQFLNAYLNLSADESIRLRQQVKLLSHKNIEDRILYYLDTNSINNKIIIKNITWLANILNIPRPSVSRSLTILINKGLLEKNKNVIIIKNSSLIN